MFASERRRQAAFQDTTAQKRRDKKQLKKMASRDNGGR
jgi:hypothetical protein